MQSSIPNFVQFTTSSAPRQITVGSFFRNIELAPALDAPRKTLVSAQLKEISYYVAGPETSTPLVLLHSINAAPSAFEMKPLFDHYRKNRRVYVPELPGFGFSDRSRRVYSPELFATAIVTFLTTIVKQPADVVAFSLSSEFAARATLTAPEYLRSLALLSPTGFNQRRLPTGMTSKILHSIFTLPLFGQALYSLLTIRPSIRYFIQRSYVGEPPVELIDYAYATSHCRGASHAPFYFLAGQLFTTNVIETLYAKLQLPVLVIYDRDANISFELLPDFINKHTNWRSVRIEPTLGIPQWEKTRETIAALDFFWQEIQENR